MWVDSGTLSINGTPTGRLAPTPSGYLHLGNVLAFAAAWLSIRSQQGKLLLRNEDIDTTRARRSIADQQKQTLSWLGLEWDTEVPAQSTRDYESFLSALDCCTYWCQCTRAQIKASGGIYTGTCRDAKHGHGALRFRLPEGSFAFDDRVFGPQSIRAHEFGDPVLLRKDGIVAYNLAVVCDDIRDGVTEVVRGADLLELTSVQLALYAQAQHPPPSWMHTGLVLGPHGLKLSKSHGALHIGALKEHGWCPGDIWALVLPWLGLPPLRSLDEAVPLFEPGKILRGPIRLHYELHTAPPPEQGIEWMEERSK